MRTITYIHTNTHIYIHTHRHRHTDTHAHTVCPENNLYTFPNHESTLACIHLGGITEMKIHSWKDFTKAFPVLYQKYHSCKIKCTNKFAQISL